MTATTLRTLLKASLHGDTTYSDPTDLNTFLSLGQQRIVRDSPHTLGVKQESISTVSGTREYSVASDYHQTVAMWHQTNGRPLDCIPLSEFMETVERLPTIPSGAPLGFCVFSYSDSDRRWHVRFDYNPDAVYTIKHWYYWMPADISGTATPPVSQIGFGELLLVAAEMIAKQRNDPDGAAVAAQHYSAGMSEYRSFNSQRPAYTPVVNPAAGRTRRGSTLWLGPSYPDV